MLGKVQYASGCGHGNVQITPAKLSLRAVAASRKVASTLRFAVDACREALAASRNYEQMRSRGITHEAALRRALGSGPAACRHGSPRHRLYSAERSWMTTPCDRSC
jgi:hypothetical protein